MMDAALDKKSPEKANQPYQIIIWENRDIFQHLLIINIRSLRCMGCIDLHAKSVKRLIRENCAFVSFSCIYSMNLFPIYKYPNMYTFITNHNNLLTFHGSNHIDFGRSVVVDAVPTYKSLYSKP